MCISSVVTDKVCKEPPVGRSFADCRCSLILCGYGDARTTFYNMQFKIGHGILVHLRSTRLDCKLTELA